MPRPPIPLRVLAGGAISSPAHPYTVIPAPLRGRLTGRDRAMSMKPVEIHEFLSQSVIGQEETLRYVSVAIFKHLQGEKYGNLLLIGNSGTGKTTIMRGIEALYQEHEELQEHRIVLILNASTLATDEGTVDTSRLFHRL